eukprot:1194503-Prorocentrum_minimum.AAC.3
MAQFRNIKWRVSVHNYGKRSQSFHPFLQLRFSRLPHPPSSSNNVFPPLQKDPEGQLERLPKLAEGWQQFYIRNLYGNIEDTFNRPITSSPDGWIDVTLRERLPNAGYFSRLQDTGATRRCLNLGSYNYLGFGGVNSYCTPVVEEAILRLPISLGSSSAELGHSEVRVPPINPL